MYIKNFLSLRVEVTDLGGCDRFLALSVTFQHLSGSLRNLCVLRLLFLFVCSTFSGSSHFAFCFVYLFILGTVYLDDSLY